MPAKPKLELLIAIGLYIKKSVGLLHHSSHTQASHGLSSQDKQCETHTEYDILSISHIIII